MNRIFAMAIKDIKLIVRDRMGMFFIVAFPIMMGVFFGLIMGPSGGSGGSGKMKVAVVDNDNTEVSGQFVASLQRNDTLQIEADELEPAKESVRKGKRVAVIVLPQGFGERAGVFWGEPPVIELGRDPSRAAETAMLQGFIMQGIGDLVGARFQNPKQFRPFLDQSRQELNDSENVSTVQRTLMNGFLDSVESMIASSDVLQGQSAGDSTDGDGEQAGMQFADVQKLSISRESRFGSRWDISFPQAMLWGVLGCVIGFAISIARERTMGTMLRLQVAPINKSSILAGKALACFLTVVAVISMVTVLGVLLGMKPNSYLKLAAAGICIAVAFVGIMMVISVLGKTEQSVSGSGMAINMVMAMLGGAMIPTMFMPGFLQKLSVISPVKWAIQSIEGAVWREFSWVEMSLPLGVLVGIGAICFMIGTQILNRQTA